MSRVRIFATVPRRPLIVVAVHVEEFKKVLGGEVSKAMSELGRMREEKRALEQQISDLFALKAKHAVGESRRNVSGVCSSLRVKIPYHTYLC